MKNSLVKKLLIAAAILMILGAAAAFYVYKYVYNKPHKDYEAAEPAMILRARQLYADYTASLENANKMYLDKVVEIEGVITTVETADSLVVVVFAYSAGDFGDEGIRVTMLPDYNEAAKQLSNLKPVKLKGHCTGYNGTDVIIESGSIVENVTVINAPVQ